MRQLTWIWHKISWKMCWTYSTRSRSGISIWGQLGSAATCCTIGSKYRRQCLVNVIGLVSSCLLLAYAHNNGWIEIQTDLTSAITALTLWTVTSLDGLKILLPLVTSSLFLLEQRCRRNILSYVVQEIRLHWIAATSGFYKINCWYVSCSHPVRSRRRNQPVA